MKLKLIRTPGFIGKPKVAETNVLDEQSDTIRCLQEIFNQPENNDAEANRARDKESMLLEFEGKIVQLKGLKLNPELEALIRQMMEELEYRT